MFLFLNDVSLPLFPSLPLSENKQVILKINNCLFYRIVKVKLKMHVACLAPCLTNPAQQVVVTKCAGGAAVAFFMFSLCFSGFLAN